MRYILIAARVFIAVTWTLLALLQLLILVPHMTALMLERGFGALVNYMSEIQSIAVEKLKR